MVDGGALESALKKLAEAAKSELPFEVKFNASTHGGVNFHTSSIPVPDRDAQKAFGNSLDVVVGTSDTRFYLAFGRNAESALKKAIDGSSTEKAVPPMQLIASLTPIFKFANSMEPNPIGSMLIDELGKTGGKDHASIVVTPSDTGVKYRIQLEEGVLRAIGAALGCMAADSSRRKSARQLSKPQPRLQGRGFSFAVVCLANLAVGNWYF